MQKNVSIVVKSLKMMIKYEIIAILQEHIEEHLVILVILKKENEAKFLPVYCHNLSGYDMNLIIKELYKAYLCENHYYKLKVLPQTKEKYIFVTFGNDQFKIVFLDSLRFFGLSLSEVAESMKDEDF